MHEQTQQVIRKGLDGTQRKQHMSTVNKDGSSMRITMTKKKKMKGLLKNVDHITIKNLQETLDIESSEEPWR